MSGRLHRALYKSLFRLATRMDRQPPAKLLIHRATLRDKDAPPPDSKDASSNSSVTKSPNSSNQSPQEVYFTFLLDKLLGKNKLFLHPSRLDHSFKSVVRREFRQSKAKATVSSRVDVGFSFLRQLSCLLDTYDCALKESHQLNSKQKEDTEEANHDAPKEKENKKLPSKRRMKVTSAPLTVQAGVVLAAHPLISGGDLHQSLILLLEHSTHYSYGVVVNKASTDHNVRNGVSGLDLEGFYDAFGENPLFFGGNVKRLSHMHRYEDCAGVKISSSKTDLYMHGSIEKAIELVQRGEAEAKSFFFFGGSCFWRPAELQEQVQLGYWLPMHAPVDEILDLALEERASQALKSEKEADDGDSSLAEESLAWKAVMRSGNRNFKEVSKLPSSLNWEKVQPFYYTADSESAF